MIKLNVKKITINYEAINKIKDYAASPQLLSIIKRRAQKIINEAKPKIPYSSDYLRSKHSFYTKKRPGIPHLRDRIAIQKEKKTNFKFEGEKLSSWNVTIKPNNIPKNKEIVYPYIVFSGVMTTKKGKISINYSNSSAIPFPIETAYRKNLKSFINETENELRRIITNDFGKDE